jgi:microcin C transport system permease protein
VGGSACQVRLSPNRCAPRFALASSSARAWLERFRRNRLGFWSLVIFVVLVVLSLFAELLSNDKPLLVRYEGSYLFPYGAETTRKPCLAAT